MAAESRAAAPAPGKRGEVTDSSLVGILVVSHFAEQHTADRQRGLLDTERFAAHLGDARKQQFIFQIHVFVEVLG